MDFDGGEKREGVNTFTRYYSSRYIPFIYASLVNLASLEEVYIENSFPALTSNKFPST
jgi:hypothetical protein